MAAIHKSGLQECGSRHISESERSCSVTVMRADSYDQLSRQCEQASKPSSTMLRAVKRYFASKSSFTSL